MPVLDALRREAPRPRIVREHRHAGWLAVTTVSAGAFLGQFDAGIVVFSLPALRRHFDTSPAAVQWVSVGYLLTMATAVIPVSRLAGAVGHKLMWTYGFVVVTAASAACGLAPSLGALITFRVAQAAGAAMIQAGSVALISTSVLREKPPAAMGVLRAAQILGLTAGPIAGGLLIATAGWRWVFLVNVPAGCVCVMAARYLLPRTRERTTAQPFGAPGMLFSALFLMTLLLLVSRVSGLGMPSAESVCLAVVCVVSALCVWWWVRHARRAVEPMSAAWAWTGIAFPGAGPGDYGIRPGRGPAQPRHARPLSASARGADRRQAPPRPKASRAIRPGHRRRNTTGRTIPARQ
jgi:MFS family permease